MNTDILHPILEILIWLALALKLASQEARIKSLEIDNLTSYNMDKFTRNHLLDTLKSNNQFMLQELAKKADKDGV